MSTGTSGLLQSNEQYLQYVALMKGEFSKEITELTKLKKEADQRQTLKAQLAEVEQAVASLTTREAALGQAMADFQTVSKKQIADLEMREATVAASEKLAAAKFDEAKSVSQAAEDKARKLEKDAAATDAKLKAREAKVADRESAVAIAEKAVDEERLRIRGLAATITAST